jgi:REP element-mobilizing transposase RayT
MYCLMPDHMHLLLMGTTAVSDQTRAIAFIRRHINRSLAGSCPFELQKQAYDHVLREFERDRGAFRAIAWYIAENPVRAGLAQQAVEWPYTGCMVSGHPDWSVFHPEYWPCFWREYESACQGNA